MSLEIEPKIVDNASKGSVSEAEQGDISHARYYFNLFSKFLNSQKPIL